MGSRNSDLFNYHIIVTGRVQGVGFRYSAINQARVLGIKGFVKNLPDGSVELEIQGDKTATKLMITWCKEGPGTGYVENIAVSEGLLKNYSDFSVRYGRT